MLALRKIRSTKEGMLLQDVPVPKCRSQDVLVDVYCVGICGSDLHIWRDEKEHKEFCDLEDQKEIKVMVYPNPDKYSP